jgi:hypothetical protein
LRPRRVIDVGHTTPQPLAAGALAISLTFLALATVERGKLGLDS